MMVKALNRFMVAFGPGHWQIPIYMIKWLCIGSWTISRSRKDLKLLPNDSSDAEPAHLAILVHFVRRLLHRFVNVSKSLLT